MKKPLFVISSPFDTYSGYGARARDLVKAIIELDKYNVKLISQPWGNTQPNFCSHNSEWSFLYNYELSQELRERPKIWMQITVPNEFQPMGEYNIGVTAGLETNSVPGEWVEGMNRMNLNLVSSNHAKQSFLNSIYKKKGPDNQTIDEIKIEKPIEVLFEGADITKYFSNNKPCMIDFNIKEDFAFLFVGHWLQGDLGEDRKNVGLLIKAFFETFKNKKNKPALILKTSGANSSYMDREDILKKISKIKKTVKSADLPNVYLLHGDFTDEEMNSLYNNSKVKAMVSLTKGEGFGRPLLEFSLVKKPIITTNWSGHLDFLNPEFVSLIGGQLNNVHPSAANNMIQKEFLWFSPNHMDIGNVLTDVFTNYKRYLEGAKRQAYYSKNNFNWDMMKIKIDNIFTTYIPNFPSELQLKLPNLNIPTI